MFTKLCSNNVVALACTDKACCFYCFCSFDPRALSSEDWTDAGKTAICPECGVDAVLPGHLSKTELEMLHEGHFG